MRKHRVFIGLGSNVPPRPAFLRRAAESLGRMPGVRLCRLSPVYETSPVGPRQRDFLNAAAEIDTTLAPLPLLRRLKKIEKALGRKRGPRWGPREIDLDVLLYGQRRLVSPGLCIPHPRWRERKFVLRPLLDLRPGLKDPSTGEAARQILGRLTDPAQRIRLYSRNLFRRGASPLSL